MRPAQIPDLDNLVEPSRQELPPVRRCEQERAYGSGVPSRVDDRDRLRQVGERGLGKDAREQTGSPSAAKISANPSKRHEPSRP